MSFFKFKLFTIVPLLVIGFFLTFNVLAVEKANKPYLKQTQDPMESLLPMIGGLVVIIAFIFLLAYLFKRFSNLNTSTKLINIVESCAIGHKEKLAIVRVENECFLIGITAGSINAIGKLDSLKLDSLKSPSKNREKEVQEKNDSGFAPLIAKFMSGNMTSEIMNKNEKIVSEKCS